MKTENIDQLFQQKINRLHDVPLKTGWNKNSVWKKIEYKLDNRNKKNRLYYCLFFLCLLAGISFWCIIKTSTDFTFRKNNPDIRSSLTSGYHPTSSDNGNITKSHSSDSKSLKNAKKKNSKEQNVYPEESRMKKNAQDIPLFIKTGTDEPPIEKSQDITYDYSEKNIFNTEDDDGFEYEMIGDNLVPNAGMEECKSPPRSFTSHSVRTLIPDWYVPTKGTPDYFHRKGDNEVKVPENYAGRKEPFDGDAYAGIYLMADFGPVAVRDKKNQSGYREYIQTKLKKPLEKDESYFIEIHHCWATYSKYAVDGLGIYISTEKIERKDCFHINVHPQISNNWGNILRNKYTWESLSGIYQAKGGEQFITIGNFKPDQETNYVQQNMSGNKLNYAYYYIDGINLVHVIKKPKKKIVASVETPNEFDTVAAGEHIVLNNIFFEFDRSVLLPSSYKELNKLFDYLNKNNNTEALIAGHTDNFGTEEYNLALSEERAKAVVDYLINKGINKERLKYLGYGKSKPITGNDSEENRSKNRRVEFVLIKK